MKFAYVVITPTVFDEVMTRMGTEALTHMEHTLLEISATLKFASYSERLIFEDAFRKGYLATYLEKLK